MTKENKGNMFVGITFFLFCIVMLIGSFSLRSMTNIAIGPEFMPRLLSVLGMTISAILIYDSFKRKPGHEVTINSDSIEPHVLEVDAVVPSDDAESLVGVVAQPKDNGAAVAAQSVDLEKAFELNPDTLKVFLLMITYALLVEPVGYLITTAIYLILHFLIVSTKEQRKIWIFLIISIVFSAVTYYIFRNFFGVLLPKGILG